MEIYNKIIYFLLGIVWHDALIVLLVGAGVYFTIRTRFLQFRSLREMVNLLLKSQSSDKGISSLQAFLVSLAGRVGTGNIAGTAAAIFWGGPGAVFWMWVIAIFGAASAYIESTLAQIYKSEIDGTFCGGPAFYANKGLGIKWYGSVLAIVITFSCIIGSPGIQSNTIAATVNTAFGIPTIVTGLIIVIALAWVIFGGIKRIANISEKIVPVMCIVYILLAIFVLIMNVTKIPAVLGLIFSSAFNGNAAFAGIIGSTIAWGVRRGVYSNEAGLGTGAPSAAAADVSHPVKQGLIQSCSIYVDTLLVCSATAFIILMTGSYNVMGPEGTMIIENLPGIDAGASYVQVALDNYIPFGSAAIAILMTVFAFTCLYGYYYQAEASFSFLMRNLSSKTRKYITNIIRLLLLVFVFLGSQFSATTAWNTADVGGGIMAWFHMILILLICKPAIVALKDYEAQRKLGIDPIFEPDKLGIKNAGLWNEINARRRAKATK